MNRKTAPRKTRLALCATLAALFVSHAAADTVEVVYVDHGVIGPRAPEATVLAPLNEDLAKLVVDRLRKRGIKVNETDPASPQAGPHDLYVSVSYSTATQRTDRPEKYRGYAVYLSQQNPNVDVSLSCGWQVAKALNGVGERPWRERPTSGRNLIDPVGLRESPSMTAPKAMKGAAIFVDAGSLADDAERTRLSDPTVIARIADAIAEGISLCRT